MQGPFFTAPNVISLARIPLAAAAVACLATDVRLGAQVLMVAAFASDALDGAVARATGTESDWGRILDPMADKLVFAVLTISLAWLGIVPWWLVAAVVGRDVLVTVGGLLHMGDIGRVPSSNALGKASTVALALYLFKQTFWTATPVFLGLDALGWVAGGFVLLSTVAYGLVYLRHRDPPLDGPLAATSASGR